MANSQNLTYTATGAEGSAVPAQAALIAQRVLLCFLGDKILVPQVTAPGVNDFVYNATTGVITVGVIIQAGQILQVIYRTP